MYGFHKQKHTDSEHYFEHETYRRGQYISEIRRKPEKKKKNNEQKVQISIQMISQALINQKNLAQNIKIDFQGLKYQKNENPQNQEHPQIESQIDSQQSLAGVLKTFEQTILQNQVLRNMDQILKKTSLDIKKFKRNALFANRNQKIRILHQPQRADRIRLESQISQLAQTLKTSTMKLHQQFSHSSFNIYA